MSESIPIVKAAAATAGGIDFPLLFLGAGAVASLGLGLNWLIKSNNPERMSTEKQEINTEINTPWYKKPVEWYNNAMDWTADTGKLVGCCLQDWFSEQSPECAAFRQRAKNDHGIYSKLAGLTSWTKGMLIGGVALAVIIPLIKVAFDHYARTGSMTVVQPEIKPTTNTDIKPEFKNDIKPEFKNEVKPEIKPEFNLNYEPGYDPDYNPNLLQNYVPTINVNTAKPQPPQIVIQPKGTVFVPYEEGKKYTRKNHGYYDWLFE